MMQPHRPEHNNKCNTKYWVHKFREGFQTLDSIFVSFLHSFVFIELLQSLLLPLLIDIDQLMMPMENNAPQKQNGPRVWVILPNQVLEREQQAVVKVSVKVRQ